MKNKLYLLCSGLVLVIIILLIGNLLLPSRPLSPNDSLVRWLVAPGRFFISEQGSESPKLCTNPQLARRGNKSRCFSLRKKNQRDFRIFCLGGSTTEGWPFQHVLSYPDFLNLELKDVLPSRHVEVINAGFSGLDSTSDVALVKELLRYEPNLLLIYEGRNEPWTMPLYSGWRAKLLIPHLWLLYHLSLYRYLRYLIDPNASFSAAAGVRGWASQRGLDYTGIAKRHMLKNLMRMIAMARQDHCRVMLVTQVTDPHDPNDSPWLKNFNDSIKRLAAAQGVPVIDAAGAFDSYRGGLGPIFLRSLWHPDVGGYFLMAKTAARALARSGLVAPAKDWRWNRGESELDYLRKLSVTPRSLAAAYIFLAESCIQPLNHRALAKKYITRAHALDHEGWPALFQ